jgi:acyl-CoA thioester hydrolase
MNPFEKRITAGPDDIDELGHVNNAVYIWVVIRHEIDYLRAVLPGETVTGRTWVGEAPRGARFDRHVEFTGEDGRPRVRAKTTWAIIDKVTGRPLRVPPEVAAPFLA